jgi:hypothetical protein
MFRLLMIVVVTSSLTGCQAVVQQRAREAKLMPIEVAYDVIDKYTSRGFSKAPTLFPETPNHPLCTNGNARPVRFEELQVLGWGAAGLTLYKRRGAEFWCGTNLMGVIKTPNLDAAEDLLDALMSVGVQVRVSDK